MNSFHFFLLLHLMDDERDKIFKHMKELLSSRNKDITIKPGNNSTTKKKFKVHRSVLEARCVEMFNCIKNNKIYLDHSCPEVEIFIEYLYLGDIPTLTLDELVNIYKLAVNWKVHYLVYLCECLFVVQLIGGGEIILYRILKLASDTHNQYLIDTCFKFIVKAKIRIFDRKELIYILGTDLFQQITSACVNNQEYFPKQEYIEDTYVEDFNDFIF